MRFSIAKRDLPSTVLNIRNWTFFVFLVTDDLFMSSSSHTRALCRVEHMSTQGIKTEHIQAVEHAAENPLILGLFLPLQSGAWSPSTAPRGTSWTFDYNARCTVLAETLGFDLVFGLAQWMGKGGYGGKMKFRESSTDPLIVTAGLAALTKRIIL